jgi:HEAT repeat protein
MKMVILHFICRPRQLRIALALLAVLGVTSGLMFGSRLVYGHDQEIQKLNRFVQQSPKPETPAMKTFREGRDLIEAENWQQAAEKFGAFIKGYPKDRDMDAALYWYAYALQKQGRKDEAAAPLVRLINNYPSSSWRREADAMLVVLGRADAVKAAQASNNCEIKVLALQSLFQADQDRALTFVADVLKSGSDDCPGLKAAAVSLVGSHGGPRGIPILLTIAKGSGDPKLRMTAIRRLGEQNNDSVADELAAIYDTDKTKEIRVQILRALAEMHSVKAEAKLVAIARSSDEIGIRLYAIRFLGERNASGSMDELIRIYDTDRTPEVRVQVLRALGERDDPQARAKLLDVAKTGETPELRVEAIRRLADHGHVSIGDLVSLYSTETNVTIKQGLLRVFADSDDPQARNKLIEIMKSGDSPELRLTAIRRFGDKDDEQTVQQLVALYDGEKDLQVRAALLRAFGDSKQKVAIRKLMDIARNDQNVELRKIAVRNLGQSKDPEALKFLEDLLMTQK